MYQWHSSAKATATPTTHPIANNSILVVDDDPVIVELVRLALEAEGFAVTSAATGRAAIELAQELQPQLLLLDQRLPDSDGLSICRALRANPRTAALPIIMVSAMASAEQRAEALESGADDYLIKPFHLPELLARIRTQFRHAFANTLSDLTQLPGNTVIQRTVQNELQEGGTDLAILYIDIDNFKAFNDAYGFLAGNEMIKAVASIAATLVHTFDPVHGFCGHVGGDDFVVVTRTPDVEALCQAIIATFESQRATFYSLADRERGYMSGTDRRGVQQHFPLATLSIGVVTTQRRTLRDVWEVSHIAADVKRKAKSVVGSAYYVDQRGNF